MLHISITDPEFLEKQFEYYFESVYMQQGIKKDSIQYKELKQTWFSSALMTLGVIIKYADFPEDRAEQLITQLEASIMKWMNMHCNTITNRNN